MYYASIKLSENICKTPEGYLLCLDVPIARTGELKYQATEIPLGQGGNSNAHKSQDTIFVTRDASVLFSPKAMASFEGKPVTINHPEQDVTSSNWRKLAVGHAQNVRRGKAGNSDLGGMGDMEGMGDMSDLLLADLLLTDSQAISLVLAGLREVSLGYEAEYEEVSAGRGRQTSIIGNHIALVSRGRCGRRCKISDKEHNMKKAKQGFWERILSSPTVCKAMDEAASEEISPAVPIGPNGQKTPCNSKCNGECNGECNEGQIIDMLNELKSMLSELLDAQTSNTQNPASSAQNPNGEDITEDNGENDKNDENTENTENAEKDENGENTACPNCKKNAQANGHIVGTKDAYAAKSPSLSASAETLRRANILTGNSSFCASHGNNYVKREALRTALSSPKAKESGLSRLVSGITKDAAISQLSGDLLSAAFVAASEFTLAANNHKTASGLTPCPQTFNSKITPQQINSYNRQFYK